MLFSRYVAMKMTTPILLVQLFFTRQFFSQIISTQKHSKAVRLWFAVFLRLKFYIRALTAARIEGLVVQG
jgi:hypothetical protein